ncbi:MAG: sulfurtransferase TusA family protein [Myxococcota bacterium]
MRDNAPHPHPLPEGEGVCARVDITGEVCPMTYVRTKLALEALPAGQVLEVLLAGDEPLKNVPRNAAEEGHQVISLTSLSGGVHRLLLRKNRS